jgi:cell wall-associated NlpC family hydrolase
MSYRRAPRRIRWRAIRRMCLLAVVGVPLAAATVRAQAPNPLLVEMSASASSLRDSLVAFARAQVGTRYRFGGASPERGFDCSGLVKYIMARFELELPRTASAQASLGVVIDRDTSQLRAGDLLLFSARDQGPVSHIGIYVGSGRFIHASSVARRVVETPLARPPAPRIKLWRGVRRIPVAPEEPLGIALAPER